MLLKPKKINIKTGGRYIVVLHEETAHKLDLRTGDRVKLKSDRTEIKALIDITDDSLLKNQIGLLSEAYHAMNLTKEDMVSITPADKPKSLTYIRKKLDGQKLSAEELNSIVFDIVNDDLSDVEMTYFVSACYDHGLDDEETANLTKAIVQNGERLEFRSSIVADKHCIGGVPGNRVTPLVVSIVVAAGILMPKTSSRAITSAAGTADALEVVTNVIIPAKRLQKIAETVGGFMVWGGGVDLAAADDRMIRVRNPMSLDPEGMLLASIIAKKHSVSATHVLIDIPVGEETKIKTLEQAEHLKKRFMSIGKKLGMKIVVIITDGSQPIGNGIGPLLEILDVIKVLKNDPNAPQDLRKKSLMMAGVLLELTGKAKEGEGETMARQIVESGRALRKFHEIIAAQGKKRIPLPAKFHFNVTAKTAGRIQEIHNKALSHLARIAGAPRARSAGLLLHKKVGDVVQPGDILFTIYAASPDRLKYALEFTQSSPLYVIA